MNDTTAGDQIDPSVSMDAQGAFVITWTGYGQNGDTSYNANIYAKQFVSNSFYEPISTNSLTTTTDSAVIRPVQLVVTTDRSRQSCRARWHGRRSSVGRVRLWAMGTANSAPVHCSPTAST